MQHKINTISGSKMMRLMGRRMDGTKYEYSAPKLIAKEALSCAKQIVRKQLTFDQAILTGYNHPLAICMHFGEGSWGVPASTPRVSFVGPSGSGKSTSIASCLNTQTANFPYTDLTKSTVGRFYYVSGSGYLKAHLSFASRGKIQEILLSSLANLQNSEDDRVSASTIRDDFFIPRNRIKDSFYLTRMGILEDLTAAIKEESYDTDELRDLASTMAGVIENRIVEVLEQFGARVSRKDGKSVEGSFVFFDKQQLFFTYGELFWNNSLKTSISGLCDQGTFWLPDGERFVLHDTMGLGHGDGDSDILRLADESDLIVIVGKMDDYVRGDIGLQLIEKVFNMGKRERLRLMVTHLKQPREGSRDSPIHQTRDAFRNVLRKKCPQLRGVNVVDSICSSIIALEGTDSLNITDIVKEGLDKIRSRDFSNLPLESSESVEKFMGDQCEQICDGIVDIISMQRGYGWMRVYAYCQRVRDNRDNRGYEDIEPEATATMKLSAGLRQYFYDQKSPVKGSDTVYDRLVDYRLETFIKMFRMRVRDIVDTGSWSKWCDLSLKGSGNRRVDLVKEFFEDCREEIIKSAVESIKESYAWINKQISKSQEGTTIHAGIEQRTDSFGSFDSTAP